MRARVRGGRASASDVEAFVDAAWLWLKALAASNAKVQEAVKNASDAINNDTLSNLEWALERSQRAVAKPFDFYASSSDSESE